MGRSLAIAVIAALAALPAGAPPAPAQTLPPAVQPSGRNAEVDRLLTEAWKLEGSSNPAQAEHVYKAAIATAEKIQVSAERAELGRAWRWLAFYYSRQARFAVACAAAERSLAAYEEWAPADNEAIVQAHGAIGIFANRARDFAKAESHLRWIVEAYERDPHRISVTEAGTASLNLSTSLRGLGRVPAAEAALRRAIEIRDNARPRDESLVAIAWWWLADFLSHEKRGGEAEAAYATAVRAAERLQSSPTQDTLATVLMAQANWLRTQRRHEPARAAAERALQLRDASLGPDHPATSEAHLVLGHIANAENDRATSERELRIVLDSYKRNPTKPGVRWAAAAAYELAVWLRVAQKPAESVSMMLEAIDLRERELPNELERLAWCYRVLGLAYLDQNKLVEAEPAFRKSIDLYGRSGKGETADAGHVQLGLGDTLFEAGRYREAADILPRAVVLFATGGDAVQVSTAEMRLATTYRYLRRLADSEALARKVLALREQKLPPDDPLIGEAVFGLAAALRWQGKNAEAEPLYRRSLAIREKAYGPDNQHVLADRYGLAMAIDSLGRIVEAEGLLRQLAADRERVLGAANPDVAETLVSLVWTLRRQGRSADAATFAERALTIHRKALGPEHPRTVSGLLALAAVHQDRSEYDEAEQLYREALRIRQLVYGAESTNAADSYGDLARLSTARRQFEEATDYAARSLAIYESRFGADNLQIVSALADLQVLKAFTGDVDAVEALGKRILEIVERAYGADSLPVALASMNVARVYRLRGRVGNVELFYERPLAIFQKMLGPRHPLVAQALGLLADTRVQLGRPDEAMSLYDQALAILVERYGENSPALAGALTSKALLLMQLKRLDEAQQFLKRAATLLREGAGKPTDSLAIVLVNLSFVADAMDRQSEAAALRHEAVDIFSRLYGPNRLPPITLAPLLAPAAREI